MIDTPIQLFPSPISLVWKLSPPDCAPSTYFYPIEIKGPGFGNDVPELLGAMAGIHSAIQQSMKGRDFFISMCPEDRHARWRDPVGKNIPIPDFDTICSHLEWIVGGYGVNEQCRLEINIENRDSGYRPLSKKGITLRISPIMPDRSSGSFARGELEHSILILDYREPVIAQLVDWYEGFHGLVSWEINPSVLNHNYRPPESAFIFQYCEIPGDHGIYRWARKMEFEKRHGGNQGKVRTFAEQQSTNTNTYIIK
jgi:hypothetical protein